jgi:hypothetical protein
MDGGEFRMKSQWGSVNSLWNFRELVFYELG